MGEHGKMHSIVRSKTQYSRYDMIAANMSMFPGTPCLAILFTAHMFTEKLCRHDDVPPPTTTEGPILSRVIGLGLALALTSHPIEGYRVRVSVSVNVPSRRGL